MVVRPLLHHSPPFLLAQEFKEKDICQDFSLQQTCDNKRGNKYGKVGGLLVGRVGETLGGGGGKHEAKVMIWQWTMGQSKII